MEPWSGIGFYVDNESIEDIELRLHDYLQELGESFSLTDGHMPSSEPFIISANPVVFHVDGPDGRLMAEIILIPDEEQSLYVELIVSPELDEEIELHLTACINPDEWYGPVVLSLPKGGGDFRPIIIDNIASTLNYFIPWLARKSHSVSKVVPGHNVRMEITKLAGYKSGITNPIDVYQEIVLRPRQQGLREWRSKAIRYTLEEISPNRIKLDASRLEIELIMPLLESTIKEILSTWPEARRRTQIEEPENSSADPTKTILFIASDPSDLSRLRLGKEVREISEKLQLAELRRFRLEQRHATRVSDLTQALLDTKPNIVHFSGHGTSEGALCLEDGSGLVHPVPPYALSALFGEFSGDVECVVLNVCYSEAQANSIAKHIPYVIGMNEDIPDQAAVAFSVGFYQALGAGSSIEKAYQMGCIQIALQGIPGHLTPVLVVAETLKTAQNGSAVGQP